jgi:hypothetical protein
MRHLICSTVTLLALAVAAHGSQLGGPIAPDGKTHVTTYLPLSLRMWNVGGSDGAGLCVYTSVTHAARYQNEQKLFGLRAWAEKRPGGSWPQKLAKDVAEFAPGVRWVQSDGRDLAFLQAALKTGRMASISIPGHMLNAIHADDRWVCLMDNNAIYDRQTKRDNKLDWLTVDEFQKRWTGWVVVLLAPPPPPLAIYSAQPQPEWEPETPAIWTPRQLAWVSYPGNPGQVFLHRDGAQVGGYDYADQIWRDYLGDGKWSATKMPPLPIPAKADVLAGRTLTVADHGCWHVAAAEPRYWVDGLEVDRAAALESMQCPNCPQPRPGPRPKPSPTPNPSPDSPVLPDDAGKLRLTIVGDAAGQVAADLESSPALAGWKARLVIQSYRENDPMLVSLGLPATGFHILVQLPPAGGFAGRVVANWTSYGGPAALAVELAKLDPSGPRPPQPTVPTPTPTPGPDTSTPATPPDSSGDDFAAVLAAIVTAVAGAAATKKSLS